MTLFDQLFFNAFNYFKTSTFKKSANDLANLYITLVQASLLLLLGVFFAEFFSQMNVMMMSTTKAWALFAIAVFILYFKNWIQYSGKKRKVLNANQNKKTTYSIWALLLIPFVCIFLSILMLKIF
ncbi:MAG: hypothetical protein KDD03_07640 [Gelidibacter sp.]|nr:hypothetical protein [Gelidibacter sp.]